jgi:cyclic pyranopterin phosphate synthase
MAETPLPHLNERGDARMVDVSAKEVSARSATAAGLVRLSPEAVAALRSASLPKGDALAVARIAGIQAAKKTPDLVMLCHPLALSGVDVGLSVVDEGVQIEATVRTTDRTGVEMEALTAVSVACLTVYDMVKAVDRGMRIEGVRLLEKQGGASGTWRAEE